MTRPEGDAVPPEENERVGLRRIFRHRMFALIWAGALLSNIGNWMEDSAQNWAVVSALKHDPRQSAFMSEVFNCANFVPALLLSLIAGVIADRVNLRKLLLWLQTLACLLGAGLAVTAWKGMATPWVVIAFTFAEGIVWALNGPPWQALVPRLVPRADLPLAIAANGTQFNLARLVGPFLAGLLIIRVGVSAAFAINAVSFLPVLLALWILPAHKGNSASTSARPLLSEMGTGLQMVWKQPGLRRLCIMLAAFMFLSAPAQGLLAVYVQTVMGGDSRLYGGMLGAMGLGALLGAFCMGKIPTYYPRHHLIPLAMFMAAGFMLLVSTTVRPVSGLLAMAGMGFFWMLSVNSTNAGAQLLAGDEQRGRVMSVILLYNQGFLPLGHLFAGGLAHFLSPAWIIRGMVGVLLLITLIFLFWREPAIDALERRPLKLKWRQRLWEILTAQSHRPVPKGVREEMAGEHTCRIEM
jgi:MFS family permease